MQHVNKATLSEYQKVFSNVRMGESPIEVTNEPHQTDEALEYFKRRYEEDKRQFEELNESMFEENNSNFKISELIERENVTDLERNPLNLQPLYINEENLKKYLPDKEFANHFLGFGKEVQGNWPIPEDSTP